MLNKPRIPIIILVISILLNFILIWKVSTKGNDTSIEESKEEFTKIDTLVVTDTLIIEKPVFKERFISRIDTFYQEIQLKDTIPISIPIEIPIEQTTYENDSLGKVVIEGYKTNLLYWESYNKITQVNKQETTIVTKKQKQRFNQGLSVGIGYGLINQKPDLFIGYSIQYSF